MANKRVRKIGALLQRAEAALAEHVSNVHEALRIHDEETDRHFQAADDARMAAARHEEMAHAHASDAAELAGRLERITSL